MEIMVRLALRKFFSGKYKKCASPSKAVQTLFDDHLSNLIPAFNCHSWRKNRLWVFESNSELKSQLPVVKELFSEFKGRSSKNPDQQHFV
jgi:hypothetical protein